MNGSNIPKLNPIIGKRRMTILVFVIAFPLVIFLASSWSKKIALGALLESSELTLQFFVESLTSQLEKYEFLPIILAGEKRIEELLLDEKDNAKVLWANDYLKKVNKTTAASATYVMNKDGLTLAASNWDSDGKSFVGKNFSFRPYFIKAMSGESGRYFALGTTSKKRGYYFSSPVRKGANILGALVVKVGFENLEQSWSSTNVKIVLTDENGVIFISNKPDWLLKTFHPIEKQLLTTIRNSKQYGYSLLEPIGVSEKLPYRDGANFFTVDKKRYLEQSTSMVPQKWTVHVLAETAGVNSGVLLASALAGFLYVIVALIGIYLYQRRLIINQKMIYQQKVEENLIESRNELEKRVRERTEELSKAHGDLIQAEKLAAMGRFSASITHEINQPLAAIKSCAYNSNTLIERNNLKGAQENLTKISSMINRIAKITGQLKQYARKSENLKNLVSVKSAFDNTFEVIAPSIQSENITLIKDLFDGDIYILCDQIRFEQALINLMKNAIDAMAGSDERTLKVTTQADGKVLVVKIIDTGHGIESGNIEKLFDEFFTTKKSGEGLGLGLSITYEIVREMSGTLKAENNEGGGATFLITLPIANKKANVTV